MKTEPETPEFESSADRLVDALLSEHARLGSGNDDELIGNILARTISKTAIIPARPEFGIRNWMIMGTSVAAVVAVLLLALSSFQLDDQGRSLDTFQFVVKMEAPIPSARVENDSNGEVKPSPSFAKPKAYEGALNPVSEMPSEIVSVKIEDRNFQLISKFAPSHSEFPANQAQVNSITISADESVHKGTEMRYSGEVVLTHDQFTLTAKELDVLLDKESGILVARGRAELKLASGEIKMLNPNVEELVLNGAAYSIRSLEIESNASPVLETR